MVAHKADLIWCPQEDAQGGAFSARGGVTIALTRRTAAAAAPNQAEEPALLMAGALVAQGAAATEAATAATATAAAQAGEQVHRSAGISMPVATLSVHQQQGAGASIPPRKAVPPGASIPHGASVPPGSSVPPVHQQRGFGAFVPPEGELEAARHRELIRWLELAVDARRSNDA